MTKILVVDDSAVDQKLISGILKDATDWELVFAGDGLEALEKIQIEQPDAVLTDLQMPRMDGLELVAGVRVSWPNLPVILITSQGSEELAIQALKSGASSYTPKRLLAKSLVEDLHSVLNAAGRIRNQKRLMTHVINGSIAWELDNDSALVAPLVEQVQAFVADWSQSDQLRLGMAVDEAVVNAMYHGNLEVDSSLRQEDDSAFYELARQRAKLNPYCQRRVQINADFSPEQFSIVIRDEGPGYNPAELADPTDPENLERICGRGLLLIRTFMDEVTHNELGNEISMVKRPSRDQDD